MARKGGPVGQTCPRKKAAGAALTAGAILLVQWLWVRGASVILAREAGNRAGLLTLLSWLSYPMSAISMILMIVPLAMFVSNHAPFQSLSLPRDYMVLAQRVYQSWFGHGIL